jgi:alpha-glucosidase
MAPESTPWWRDAVLYQVYARSFADSNGDGIGDLPGITAHLDHLAWLGIDGIWITPSMPSPDRDWGYDVSDYTAVHPELGDLDDLDQLVKEAAARDLKVILDLVPNHTSDQHPWFIDALTGTDAAHRDWYVWADPKPDGSPPNNWVSVFGGEAAWELDESSGQYYLHNFLRYQPDLNWWNASVRDAFEEILRFWFDRGVAGFRIDVCHAIIKDRELRDNLPATEDDPERVRQIGQRSEYNMNRPEVHDVLRGWRKICDSYDDERVLVGETFVMDLERMAAYYGDGNDELNLAFNFPFALSPFDLSLLRNIVETTDSLIPPQGWPVWMASNHDVGRFTTRWCRDDVSKIRCVLLMLLSVRGTAILYYGDEIGMSETEITKEDLRDPVGKRFWPKRKGRDPCRTPMHWSGHDGAGFTSVGTVPWLPFGDFRSNNVADQKDDPFSTLSFCRDLIAVRRRVEDLRRAPYEPLEAPGPVWAWRRGRVLVALNPREEGAYIADVAGVVAISTRLPRAGERISGALDLGPWEGVVVERDG